MAALRDHGTGAGAPRYSLVNGAMAAPCMHAGGLAANSQTTASWVAELRPGGAAHWVTATAAPCTSLFKPVQVTEPLDLGPRRPTGTTRPRCGGATRCCTGWRCATRRPRSPCSAAERDAVQARWLAAPPDPAAAFAEADELLARWTAAVAASPGGRDTRPAWARRYWQKRNTKAGLPSQAALHARAPAAS